MIDMNTYQALRESLKNPDEPTFMRALAVYYWRALLVALCLCLTLGLYFGFSEASAARAAFSELNAPQKTPPSTLTRKSVDGVVAGFTVREQRYAELKGEASTTPDPSQ